ncbi:glycosyltransferase [Flammeovirga pacifica]|nr:glycosyltransferase [Flammeovirga pacifica]
MITYNHEAYIAEAIEGVLMQRTDFPIQLIIGEDGSTDNTRKICEKYQKKHPEIIELLPSEGNLGMMPNFIKTLQACTGKYIALCEGDDYWINPNKLKKQVNFLEENEEYSLVFSNRVVKIERNHSFTQQRHKKHIFTIKDVISGFVPSTQTCLLRNYSSINQTLTKYLNHPSGDQLVGLACAQLGKIYCLADSTSVYRITETGVWSSRQNSIQFSLNIYNKLFKNILISEGCYNKYYHFVGLGRKLLSFYGYKVIIQSPPSISFFKKNISIFCYIIHRILKI